MTSFHCGRANQRVQTAVISGLIALLCIVGCAPRKMPYPDALKSERPEQRIEAIKHAAQLGDRSAIPVLIDRLEDDDSAVRFYAILSLEKLTDTRMGYDYYASEVERHRAVLRWRQWLAENMGMKPPDRAQ